MTEAELTERFIIERPMYKAWGDFVTQTVETGLKNAMDAEAFHSFLKVPAVPRVKDVNSLVNKAFYSKKQYANPYDDITDKVGVRFVVLLPKEIELVCHTICNSKSWAFSKDRDYEAERLANPMVFTYQSVHFVVKCSTEVIVNQISVAVGTPCEIQIRTILQHAYSELTHDTIYKPKVIASPIVHRTIAKSMALIETTDGFFSEVDVELTRLAEVDKSLTDFLSKFYSRLIGAEPSKDKINELVIDSFRELPINGAGPGIEELFRNKPYIKEKIVARRDHKHLFRQSVIPLIYFMANKYPKQTIENWPLTLEELRPIFIDMALKIEF